MSLSNEARFILGTVPGLISSAHVHGLQLTACAYLFKRYDVDRSNFIDLMELKLMMEKLGEPQTHLGLKAMIKEVDEDNDGQISFREVSHVLSMQENGVIQQSFNAGYVQ